MTPKEKAKELVEKYQFVEIANYTSMFEVKQCALISVDEIINTHQFDGGIDYDEMRYWEQVKHEISNL